MSQLSVLQQVKKSGLSKKGLTTITGVWEGVPSNVAAVARAQGVPLGSSVAPVIQNPIDVTYGALSQPTYLSYLKAVNK